MSRFRQAISEGDGISVIPVLAGDVAALAAAAETVGAEAIAVESPDGVAAARAQAGLPVLLREPLRELAELERARATGADACVVVFSELADEDDLLEELCAAAHEYGLDCAVDVHDEDELEQALERVDPDILIVSERERDDGLERTFELLAGVPAGKLLISDVAGLVREQVVALERAGVDAVVVRDLAGSVAFADDLADLVGGPAA